jgi:colicin import membrane protein
MSGQWPALALAIAVHVAFISVLVFSLRWQNRKPEPVEVELYAPPSKVAAAEPVVEPPPASPPPKPEPAPEPKPAPPPPEKVAPKPEPEPPKKAAPKAEPKVDKPDPRAAEIAQKARREEEEKKKREQQAREKKEAEKKEAEKQEAARKEAEKKDAEKKREAERRVAEARERQAREAEALRAQADREQAARAQQRKSDAEAVARDRAEADYVRRIQSKVKGNVVLPPDVAGNPEATFDVVQLPTGEIIDAVLRKSSGSRVYDEAWQRAIIKSSPLPRPDRPELFQRTLTLKFRAQD